MPLNPQRVQGVFLEAANCRDLADRAAILERECSGDPELRERVEALVKVSGKPRDKDHAELRGQVYFPNRGATAVFDKRYSVPEAHASTC